jgi:tRNA 2-selenouridine synthase
MTWREITPENLNALKNTLVIDVRSPGEHEAERIPNSVNVPLLSDVERAEVGTIYKEQGEMVARRHALKMISPKIPLFIERVDELRQHGNAVVIYCWRGGMRSESVASVLSIAGIDCFRLTGGYKAWRGQVVADFENDAYPFQPAVLHGLTGVGKTEILAALATRGQQVLDLEAIANHRGSVFGGLGLGSQPTQKNFDAALWQHMRAIPPNSVVFLEAESRKVGSVRLPDCVLKRIEGDRSILVTGSVQKRAERIAADYLHPSRSPETELGRGLALLDRLKERLGGKLVLQLKDLIAAGEILEAVKVLLVDYYDPLYSRQIERNAPFELEVNGDDVEAAAEQIAAWSETRFRRKVTVPQV